jgi:hypothetical protein
MTAEFSLAASLHTPQGSLTRRKILRHGADGFTSPQKEVVIRIFIALNNPLLLADFERANVYKRITCIEVPYHISLERNVLFSAVRLHSLSP